MRLFIYLFIYEFLSRIASIKTLFDNVRQTDHFFPEIMKLWNRFFSRNNLGFSKMENPKLFLEKKEQIFDWYVSAHL